MQNTFQTDRLILNELSSNDYEFIKELVNTQEWIQFIGQRNINSNEDSKAYIQKIIDNPNVKYWVVRLKDQQLPIGIITLIKRDYLEHHDIGFALLPKYSNNGYAYEAAKTVLDNLITNPLHTLILATTLQENTNSIKLLNKLGLRFNKEIKVENELLSVFSTPSF